MIIFKILNYLENKVNIRFVRYYDIDLKNKQNWDLEIRTPKNLIERQIFFELKD